MTKNIKTLSVYFLGTTFDIDDSLNSLKTRGYEELIGFLFKKDTSKNILLETKDEERKAKSKMFIKVIENLYPVAEANHYKMIVKGVGSNNNESFFTDKKEQIKQGIGVGLSSRCVRVLEAIEKLISPKDKNKPTQGFISYLTNENNSIETVNLFGFSRGGITAIEVANELVKKDEIKSVNIFVVDPVYGSPINKSDSRIQLIDPKNKIKKFVGIYALHEQSLYFDAVIPLHYEDFFNITQNKFIILFLPGLHETLIGNSSQFWKKTKNAKVTREQEIHIKPISDFVFKLVDLISYYWKIPRKNNLVHNFSDDLEDILINICESTEISEIMKQVAPKSQFVPNITALFPKKYIFSDGTGRTIQDINDKYSLQRSTSFNHNFKSLTNFNINHLTNLMESRLRRQGAIKRVLLQR
jgi:hypothetical protein